MWIHMHVYSLYIDFSYVETNERFSHSLVIINGVPTTKLIDAVSSLDHATSNGKIIDK
jgi:hypothetical protein